MKQYHIYHTVDSMNKFQEREVQSRKYAGFVRAESLEEAFMKSQNIDSAWNPVNPCRSTSVGDVISDDEGFHMVCGMGFKLLEYNDHVLTEGNSELKTLENQINTQ